jgi:hypothetical protein
VSADSACLVNGRSPWPLPHLMMTSSSSGVQGPLTRPGLSTFCHLQTQLLHQLHQPMQTLVSPPNPDRTQYRPWWLSPTKQFSVGHRHGHFAGCHWALWKPPPVRLKQGDRPVRALHGRALSVEEDHGDLLPRTLPNGRHAAPEGLVLPVFVCLFGGGGRGRDTREDVRSNAWRGRSWSCAGMQRHERVV